MEEKKLYFKVEKNVTLAQYLKEQLSRRFYRKLKFLSALIYVNDIITPLYKEVHIGDEIRIIYQKEKEATWQPLSKELKIIYEDEHYAIVYKEADLLTIPIKACPESLYQQLLFHFKSADIHILNRLDRKTSGLVVIAKDSYAASLLEPTHEHIVRKYICLVEGNVLSDGTICKNISKCEDSNKRYISETGKRAVSHYHILKQLENQTLLEFVLETGRTHQIRLHSSSIGHPIVGDSMYGNGKEEDFLYLTSYAVTFTNPFNNKVIDLKLKEGWWNE